MSERDETVEWPSGLEGVETWQLVDELLKRGWETSTRTRNSRPRVVLLAPRDYSPQRTGRTP